MKNIDDSPQPSPLNTLYCDRCGHAETIPLIEMTDEVPAEEMEHLIQERFFAVKCIFGASGWFTSVGYDLCPVCCKDTGTNPGYSENGLLPQTVVIPRSSNLYKKRKKNE